LATPRRSISRSFGARASAAGPRAGDRRSFASVALGHSDQLDRIGQC
jgi:hypothetical protein